MDRRDAPETRELHWLFPTRKISFYIDRCLSREHELRKDRICAFPWCLAVGTVCAAKEEAEVGGSGASKADQTWGPGDTGQKRPEGSIMGKPGPGFGLETRSLENLGCLLVLAVVPVWL